jgi:hypothetical protein
MSRIYRWIESSKFGAGVFGRKLPVDRRVAVVAMGLPLGNFRGQLVAVVDALFQALAGQYVQFDLSHVELGSPIDGTRTESQRLLGSPQISQSALIQEEPRGVFSAISPTTISFHTGTYHSGEPVVKFD